MRAWLLALAVASATAAPPPLPYADDGDRASLLSALDHDVAYLSHLHASTLTLAGQSVPVSRMLASAERLRALVADEYGTPRFSADVAREFDALPMDAQPDRVFFTGYHLPLLQARHRPDATYRYPIYAPPKDLVHVDLGAFAPDLAGRRLVGRLDGDRLVPYYTRAQIDDGHALAGRGLALGWVADDLDRYSLMVQGSGLLDFGDGQIVNVNYAGENGQPYRSLGKALVADGKIPQAQISMPAIRAYFAAHPDALHGYLLRNPSYVFFRLAPNGPFGVTGMPLTAGRAIATDQGVYAAGAIAWLRYPRACFDACDHVTAWQPSGRFVIDADAGGAIRGPDRVDIYFGGGHDAARRAGTLDGHGDVTFLLLKQPSIGD